MKSGKDIVLTATSGYVHIKGKVCAHTWASICTYFVGEGILNKKMLRLNLVLQPRHIVQVSHILHDVLTPMPVHEFSDVFAELLALVAGKIKQEILDDKQYTLQC